MGVRQPGHSVSRNGAGGNGKAGDSRGQARGGRRWLARPERAKERVIVATSDRPIYPEIEGAIIFYVLEHDEATLAELQKALGDEPRQIAQAVTRLRDVGILLFNGELVRPTICCRYFDRLGLLDI